ncbi:MAG: type II toxin-antitoxin system VapC family toxin [Burkholderiales bacterium]
MPRLLLDTHVALWWFAAHPRLSAGIREEIGRSECWLSACSIWEVAIKFRLGKLPVAPDVLLAAARAANFRLLSMTPEHSIAVARLPELHSDPFDRILIAQAQQENLLLLTADKIVSDYGQNVRHLDSPA